MRGYALSNSYNASSIILHTNVTFKCKKYDPCHENIDTIVGPRGYSHERRENGVRGEHTIIEEIGCYDVECCMSRKHVVVTVGQGISFFTRCRFRAGKLSHHIRDGTHEVHDR